VTSQLGLKFSPEIFFAYDASVAEGDKIDRLIREVREREGW
jgi:ribosome-binding factor A